MICRKERYYSSRYHCISMYCLKASRNRVSRGVFKYDNSIYITPVNDRFVMQKDYTFSSKYVTIGTWGSHATSSATMHSYAWKPFLMPHSYYIVTKNKSDVCIFTA